MKSQCWLFLRSRFLKANTLFLINVWHITWFHWRKCTSNSYTTKPVSTSGFQWNGSVYFYRLFALQVFLLAWICFLTQNYFASCLVIECIVGMNLEFYSCVKNQWWAGLLIYIVNLSLKYQMQYFFTVYPASIIYRIFMEITCIISV